MPGGSRRPTASFRIELASRSSGVFRSPRLIGSVHACGPVNASSWRPDPTGGRLVAIRAAKRGALIAAFLFGILVVVAAVVAPPIGAPSLDRAIAAGVVAALFSLPGLALLGAGLTPAALGSRSSATSAGLAIGVGVPVAAVASAMIAAFVIVAFVAEALRGDGVARGADAAGMVLRAGVIAAVRISPLIAVASTAWVLIVRRLARTGRSG